MIGVNGTHKLLIYADDVNLLGKNMNMRRKNRGALLASSKEVGLKVNAEKAKKSLYLVTRMQEEVRIY
jgi:hypothetical protein